MLGQVEETVGYGYATPSDQSVMHKLVIEEQISSHRSNFVRVVISVYNKQWTRAVFRLIGLVLCLPFQAFSKQKMACRHSHESAYNSEYKTSLVMSFM